MELEAMAGIFADFGQKLDEHHKKMADTMRVPKPIGRTIGGSAVATTGVITNLNCQQFCPVGKMWEIRLIGLFGNDTHTVVASTTADVFSGSLQDENTSDFTSCFLSGVPIPTVKDYGRRHILAYPGENVYALVTGATTGQGLVICAVVDEWDWSDAEAMRV